MMEVEKTTQTEEVKPEEQVLSDLPVNDEQANETNGGTDIFSLNYTKIDYR